MPEEITLTLTAPVDKVDWFVTGFLKCRPVPLDNTLDSDSPSYGQPLYSVKEHIKREIIKDALRVAKAGNLIIHAKTAETVKDALI